MWQIERRITDEILRVKGFSSVVQHINVYSTQFLLVTNYLGILKSFSKSFSSRVLYVNVNK